MIESRCQRANDTASTAFNTDQQPTRLRTNPSPLHPIIAKSLKLRAVGLFESTAICIAAAFPVPSAS